MIGQHPQLSKQIERVLSPTPIRHHSISNLIIRNKYYGFFSFHPQNEIASNELTLQFHILKLSHQKQVVHNCKVEINPFPYSIQKSDRIAALRVHQHPKKYQIVLEVEILKKDNKCIKKLFYGELNIQEYMNEPEKTVSLENINLKHPTFLTCQWYPHDSDYFLVLSKNQLLVFNTDDVSQQQQSIDFQDYTSQIICDFSFRDQGKMIQNILNNRLTMDALFHNGDVVTFYPVFFGTISCEPDETRYCQGLNSWITNGSLEYKRNQKILIKLSNQSTKPQKIIEKPKCLPIETTSKTYSQLHTLSIADNQGQHSYFLKMGTYNTYLEQNISFLELNILKPLKNNIVKTQLIHHRQQNVVFSSGLPHKEETIYQAITLLSTKLIGDYLYFYDHPRVYRLNLTSITKPQKYVNPTLDLVVDIRQAEPIFLAIHSQALHILRKTENYYNLFIADLSCVSFKEELVKSHEGVKTIMNDINRRVQPRLRTAVRHFQEIAAFKIQTLTQVNPQKLQLFKGQLKSYQKHMAQKIDNQKGQIQKLYTQFKSRKQNFQNQNQKSDQLTQIFKSIQSKGKQIESLLNDRHEKSQEIEQAFLKKQISSIEQSIQRINSKQIQIPQQDLSEIINKCKENLQVIQKLQKEVENLLSKKYQ